MTATPRTSSPKRLSWWNPVLFFHHVRHTDVKHSNSLNMPKFLVLKPKHVPYFTIFPHITPHFTIVFLTFWWPSPKSEPHPPTFLQDSQIKLWDPRASEAITTIFCCLGSAIFLGRPSKGELVGEIHCSRTVKMRNSLEKSHWKISRKNLETTWRSTTEQKWVSLKIVEP